MGVEYSNRRKRKRKRKRERERELDMYSKVMYVFHVGKAKASVCEESKYLCGEQVHICEESKCLCRELATFELICH